MTGSNVRLVPLPVRAPARSDRAATVPNDGSIEPATTRDAPPEHPEPRDAAPGTEKSPASVRLVATTAMMSMPEVRVTGQHDDHGRRARAATERHRVRRDRTVALSATDLEVPIVPRDKDPEAPDLELPAAMNATVTRALGTLAPSRRRDARSVRSTATTECRPIDVRVSHPAAREPVAGVSNVGPAS